MAEREALKREIEELQSKCEYFICISIFQRNPNVVSAFPQTLRSLLVTFKEAFSNSVADLTVIQS